MRKIMLTVLLVLLGSLIMTLGYGQKAHAYTNSRMIDDQVFDKVNSMSEQQIRNFINSRPNTCLTRVGSGFGGGAVFPEPFSYWDYSGGVDAARVIYKSAQAWGINPQVLLATLQKEQSLLTDNDCVDGQGFPTLRKAMGQGCAEGGPCPSADYDGFSQQVMKGAWQLKFNKERAYGNTSWDGDDNVVYSGFMTQGYRKRCGTCSTNYYSGYATIDGQSTYLENGATAALYTFTPHLNQSFPGIFEQYFGSTWAFAYQWQFVSQSSNVDLNSLQAGQKATVTFVARNIGYATWTNSGTNQINVVTSRPDGRNSTLEDSSWLSPNTPARMQQSSVAYGNNGTFTFTIQAPSAPGQYREYFNLVAQGITFFNDVGQFFQANVSTPSLPTSTTSTSYSATMNSDSQASVTIRLRNQSSNIWYKGDRFPTRLGTAGPMERDSQFYSSGWLSSHRPAVLQETSVAPSQDGTFTFTLTAPHMPGVYTETFALLQEQVAWSTNTVSLVITVKSPYWAVSPSPPSTSAVAGETESVTLSLVNNGTATWTNTGPSAVRLVTNGPLNRLSSLCDSSWSDCSTPATLTQSSVAPGATGTFTFNLKAGFNVRGLRTESFIPANGQEWFGGTNLNINVTQPVFRWSWNSQSAYTNNTKSTPVDLTDLSPGQTAWLVVKANNTGDATWHNTGAHPVRIGSSRPVERPSRFATSAWLSPSRPTTMVETSTAPGDTATFEFPIQIPAGGGTWREYFNPLAEGYTWMNDDVGQHFPMTVKSTYRWSWNSQTAYTNSSKSTTMSLAALTPGQTAWLVVKANNTGDATWYKTGAYPVRIGTARPLERLSRFGTGAWMSPSRPATMSEASVNPGSVATFEFPIAVPAGQGSWREYFNPLAESYTWMNDDVGQFFPITVP